MNETIQTPDDGEKSGPGAVQSSPGTSLERVNVMLSRRSLDTLDVISAKILKNTGRRANRSEIIRAMAEAFGESHLEFVGIRTEADMKTVLLRYFGEIGRMILRTRLEARKRR